MSQRKRKKRRSNNGNPLNYSKIKGGMRRLWMWYDAGRKEAIENSKVCRGAYQCSACKRIFKLSEVQAHHLFPVICPHRGFKTWGELADRLFVKAAKLIVVCKKCHKEK